MPGNLKRNCTVMISASGLCKPEPVFVDLLRSPGIDYLPWRAGTKTLFVVLARQATWAGEIDSSESMPGLHKRLQIRAQSTELLRTRACTFKRLWSPGIDSEDSMPLAYVAWRVGTTYMVVVPVRQAGNRFLGSFKGLQIRALAFSPFSDLASPPAPPPQRTYC
jgi:hypothetical protein